MKAIGPILFLAVALPAFGGPGCSHEARPVVQPEESSASPPLPPASGTPIGFLVDASELKLSDDQLAKLKVIDGELATKLAYLDAVYRSASVGDAPQDKHDSRGGIGLGVSGDRTGADGQTGPPPVRVDSSPGTGPSSGGGSPASTREESAAVRKRVPEVRAHDVRTAIARTLALLDPGQQKIARQVLKNRGVDPDTGRFEATGEPGPGRGKD